MTTYNTGNALGSSDARDLYDNAENIDNFANGSANTYQDRLGVTRKSLAGMNAAFDDFIESSGYTLPVAYTSGIVLSEYNQLIEYNDEFYKLKAGQAPYTTTGTWGTDSTKLVAVGDAAMRQELTSNANDFNLLPEIGNYAALRAYTGPVTAYYMRGVANIFDGGSGIFRVDAADTTTTDNGGTVLVDAAGRRWKREFSGAVNVRWFGAGNTANDSPAIQAAADFAKSSQRKIVGFPTDAEYTLGTALNCTTSDFNGMSFVSIGGRRSVVIKCETGGWAVDLSGSAWTTWRGLYFIHGSTNISTGGFILGGIAADPECLYHNFDNCFVEIYNAAAPASHGTIGFAVIGSEENTFHACNVFANTPFIFSTVYSTISADYPSPYQTILAAHSCGVNTFSGENVAVTYDKKKPNIQIYGANSLDLGNIYFGNINILTPGTEETCINFLGGTSEGVRGFVKIENKSTLLNFSGGEMFDWRLGVAFGGGVSSAYPVVSFATPSALAKNKVLGLECDVSYYSPTDAAFVGKKLLTGAGVSGGSGNEEPQLANIKFSVNQDSGLHGNPFFPAQFCGVGVNCVMEFPDCTYTLNKHTHVKQLNGQAYIGVGSGPGDIVGKVYLPAITPGFSARTLSVRLSGLVSSINENTGAAETLVTTCYFDTLKGAYSINDGAVVVGSNGASSDVLNDTTSVALSNDAGLALFTGIILNMSYNAGDRTIDLVTVPKGSGVSLGGVLTFLNDLKMEMVTSGRKQELIYLS